MNTKSVGDRYILEHRDISLSIPFKDREHIPGCLVTLIDGLIEVGILKNRGSLFGKKWERSSFEKEGD